MSIYLSIYLSINNAVKLARDYESIAIFDKLRHHSGVVIFYYQQLSQITSFLTLNIYKWKLSQKSCLDRAIKRFVISFVMTPFNF